MMSIKDYAQSQGVSYEAVRQQLNRYKDQLDDHIIKKGRQQFLDDYAIDFLTEKRNAQPVVVVHKDQTDRIRELETKLAVLEALLSQRNEDCLNLQKVAENRFLEASKVKYLEKDVERLEIAQNRSESIIKQRDDELHSVKQQLLNKENEIKKLRSRRWLARLLNKE